MSMDNVLADSTKEAIYEVADREGLNRQFCLAIAKIESDCTPFMPNDYPLVRFERHVFLKYIKRNHVNLLDKAIPLTGTTFEYYQKAKELEPESAILATSFGLYQIMGFNHRYVGYDTPTEFEEAMCANVKNQVEAFAKFIKVAKLKDAINNKDFHKFAKTYNGPNYQQYRYADRLKTAYDSAVKVGL